MGQSLAVVQQFFDLFGAGKIDETTPLFAESCISLMPNGSFDRAAHEQVGQAFRAAFPDCRMDVDKAVESGEEVVVLGHFRGTHRGDLVSPQGTLPASGRPLNLRFADYFKVVDGVIVDHQTTFDQMELMAQLGALPGA